MNELDQATINLHYARAQARRIKTLEEDNHALKELIEKLRLYLIAKKREDKQNGIPRNPST